MRFHRGTRFAENVASLVGECLGFIDGYILESELLACREAAFQKKDADAFAVQYLRSECLSKYSGSELPTAEADALLLADQQESLNSETEKRLAAGCYSAATSRRLLRACRLLEETIRPIQRFDDILPYCGFGPGATAGRGRRTSALSHKWQPIPEGTSPSHFATSSTIPYLHYWFKQHQTEGWKVLPERFTIVPGDTVTTVPKSWKIRRTINCQPNWNLFLQKGLGGALRYCARSRGLLYANAQDVQRKRAREGSVTGLLSTVDLRNASASNTNALISLLVEGPVYRMLNDFRCTHPWLGDVRSPSTWKTGARYHMVSTMGNGFTFELETLLYWALTAAVGEELGHHWSTVTVFGDDIICPTDTAKELVEFFQELGLVINPDKSFVDGSFRESCGGHYFEGEDVTPFYLKEPVTDAMGLIELHNKAFTWLNRRGFSDHSFLRPLTQFCRRETNKQFFGPPGMPGVLWASWDMCVPSWNRKTQSYVQYVCSKEVVSKVGDCEAGRYNAALYLMSQRREAPRWAGGWSNPVCFRSELRSPRLKRRMLDSLRDQDDSMEFSFERGETKHVVRRTFVDRNAWTSNDYVISFRPTVRTE